MELGKTYVKLNPYQMLPLIEVSQNVITCLWLHATCSCLRLSLGVFATLRSNFNYFGHFYKYVTTIENFITMIEWFTSLFSSINRLICPISRNTNQINHTLKIFYGDFDVYFYVSIEVICMINKYFCIY